MQMPCITGLRASQIVRGEILGVDLTAVAISWQ